MLVYLDQRMRAISQLGHVMGLLARNEAWPGFACGLSENEYTAINDIIDTHHFSNGWFTKDNIRKSLEAWHLSLQKENMDKWLSAYDFSNSSNGTKKVGIICAGNIPLVGLHDVICVLLSGHHALIKLSSSDDKLLPALLQVLVNFEPAFAHSFEFVEQKLSGQQAVIATGSNNTSRYFRYYFKDIPHIIRKSRTSVAILDGSETLEEINALGSDIFEYFGLGCRNVSKMYLPVGFDIDRFFNAIYPFNPIVNHNKYANNYDYNKAVWLLNQDNLLDNGFILLKEEKAMASPTASLYYEYYTDKVALKKSLEEVADELQCIVGHDNIAFGQAQCPSLWDYADGVDTMKFLLELG